MLGVYMYTVLLTPPDRLNITAYMVYVRARVEHITVKSSSPRMMPFSTTDSTLTHQPTLSYELLPLRALEGLRLPRHPW